MPWYEPSKRRTPSLPVSARAVRNAIITASEPEFVNRSRSTTGTRSEMRSASATSCRDGRPKQVPSSSAAIAAAITTGCRWPCTRVV